MTGPSVTTLPERTVTGASPSNGWDSGPWVAACEATFAAVRDAAGPLAAVVGLRHLGHGRFVTCAHRPDGSAVRAVIADSDTDAFPAEPDPSRCACPTSLPTDPQE